MKYIAAILFALFTITPTFSQSNIRLNNFRDNTYYINPGSINDEYDAVFSLAARKQWLGFPGSPNTLFAAGTLYSDKIQTQFGLKVFADKLGYNTITNLSLSYSYGVILNREWQLNMGVAASFQCLSYDRSEVNVMTPDDPALYDNLLQQNDFNADAGAELIGNSWKFGLSSMNLLTLFYNDDTQQVNSSYAYAMYRKKTLHPIDLQYGACVIRYNDLYQMELNITTFFKFSQESDMFHAGLFTRNNIDKNNLWNEMGVLLGCSLSESIQLSYSYDFNVSGISRSSVGTHELMLTYKLNKIAFKKYRY
ncbi:MAG: PorP/SprF family type IX secretion system membrane protein [Paludibacter sp.]|nr:PorP/SprF family type IX secretion system membrane protein [Paludibacter sp.]